MGFHSQTIPAPHCSDGDICLRALEYEDISLVAVWLVDYQLALYAFGLKLDCDPDHVERVCSDYLWGMRDAIDHYACIEHRGEPIGVMYFLIRSVDELSVAVIGILIGTAVNRNQGYGTVALELMLYHLFVVCNCDRVELDTAEYNIVSQKLYRKAGFSRSREMLSFRYEKSYDDTIDAPRLFYYIDRDTWIRRQECKDEG